MAGPTLQHASGGCTEQAQTTPAAAVAVAGVQGRMAQSGRCSCGDSCIMTGAGCAPWMRPARSTHRMGSAPPSGGCCEAAAGCGASLVLAAASGWGAAQGWRSAAALTDALGSCLPARLPARPPACLPSVQGQGGGSGHSGRRPGAAVHPRGSRRHPQDGVQAGKRPRRWRPGEAGLTVGGLTGKVGSLARRRRRRAWKRRGVEPNAC